MVGATGTKQTAWSTFTAFLRLGLTSFGGPVAHLGYFRNEFVVRRGWLSERSYADLLALCQFLPGPASSQVAMGIGLARAGHAGALAAWAGFTLPSAIAMLLFAGGLAQAPHAITPGVLDGLKCVAVAVVAQAVWAMARSHCRDLVRLLLMIGAAVVVLRVPGAWPQLAVMAGAGVAGLVGVRRQPSVTREALQIRLGRRAGAAHLLVFAALLAGLPLLAQLRPGQALAMMDAFYRVGSLVFGGGHVVLPLLQEEVVPRGWLDNDTFLAGYGAAQAVPGPLFSFAAFLGASMRAPPSGWWGGSLALLAIYAPSYLLVAGTLPFWERLRHSPPVQAALAGVNAAVVGLLLAALYDPVWTSAFHDWRDLALMCAALGALLSGRMPLWLIVLGCAVAGMSLQR